MKKQKTEKVPFSGLALVLLEVLAISGIVVASLSSAQVAAGMTIFCVSLALAAKIVIDRYLSKTQLALNRFNADVKVAVGIIKRKAQWDLPLSGYEPDLRETMEDIKGLYDALEKSEDDRTEFLNMMNTVASNMEIDALFEALLPNLVKRLRSSWGAFYLANNTAGKLELRSSIGFSNNIYRDLDLAIGEGLIGAAAASRDITVYNDLPEDTMFVTKTFLGKISPKGVMLAPIINNDLLLGVLCLAGLYPYAQEQIDSVNLIKYYLGLALGNCISYERSKRLASELQFQNNLIQTLNDELENKVKDMYGDNDGGKISGV
jgi:hypothetical protein